MAQCKFHLAWIGTCKNPAEPSSDFCAEHVHFRCVSCGQQATHQCAETGFGVCGEPLCGDCTHTLRDNGCNEGGMIPPGYGTHCRSADQAFRPWYRGKDAKLFNERLAAKFRTEAMTREQVLKFVHSLRLP